MAEPWPAMLMPPMSLKEAYDRLEKMAGPALNVWLGTDTANRTLGLVREQIIAQERRQREWFEGTWRKLRLPSSTDLTRVARQIVQVEDRLTQIEDRIDEPADSNLSGRLDGLDQRLTSLMTAISSLESALAAPSAPAKS